MRRNKGFTLVEVMVTIAIMGVLAGIIGITVGVLSGQRVKSMAADTKSVIQSTQIVAYSREDAYIVLTQDGSNAIVVAKRTDDPDGEINRAEGHNVVMWVSFDNGDPVQLSGEVTVHFNRQTGGLMPQSDGTYLTAIEFHGSNNRVERVRISKLTGKATYK